MEIQKTSNSQSNLEKEEWNCTGEQFEFPTTIYPSADPEKFHGNLEFYAYYQEP